LCDEIIFSGLGVASIEYFGRIRELVNKPVL